MSGTAGDDDRLVFSPDGWRLTLHGDSSSCEGWAGTLLALSNGSLGVRGAIEERAHATTFLAHAYEQSPIHYHERLHGFAASTDSRVPVVEPLGLELRIDGASLDLAEATSDTVRTLDLRTGILVRETCWSLPDGRTLTVEAQRLVPFDGRTMLLRRLRASCDGAAVTLHPRLLPAPHHAAQSNDPRLGVDLATGGFVTSIAAVDHVIERLSGSGIGVAAVQRTRETDAWLEIVTGYAVGTRDENALEREAGELAGSTTFDPVAERQRDILDAFWSSADLHIDGDARLAAALRLNLFHLFASAGRDGRSSAAAKGLTGEGYEGHYFWDAEAFMLPALVMLAPDIARAMLLYRARTLDAAIANARALDHERGALYAWRTIAGREASAHYPSGSAQYHINAAIAFAIGFYVDATGDESFLFEHGARMLVETARLWLTLGDWADGHFHLRGVTGPDEYTALVDDNWYTNRMAQKNLRLAVGAAARLADHDAEAFAALTLADDELAAFTAAADAMHLPYDAARDLDAQDASFLDKPRWNVAGTPRERFPLLLHYHPMTLYRHQVAKQADLILGLVLGGEEVSRERKRSAFAHYEPITTHDSTLSAATFAILAAEIGNEDAALRFMADAAFVDVDDAHGNTGHGVHMAAMAGSWMALVWGVGGFRPDGATLRFRPILPAAWRGYGFGVQWRGTTLRVDVSGDAITYRNAGGPALGLYHHNRALTRAPGGEWTGALA